MKRIVQLLSLPLVLSCAAIPVQSFGIGRGLWGSLGEVVESSAMRLTRGSTLNPEFVISTFAEPGIVDSFSTAWRRSGNGTTFYEGVVLIVRSPDGSTHAIELGSTNEYKRFTFFWRPNTIAVVHTHPNSSSPKPQDDDIVLANNHMIPVFTITNRGMYVYDPNTRKTHRIKEDLDWLDPNKWKSR